MKARITFIGLAILTVVLVWWSRDFIFFWDSVQFAGKHGLWYYEEGILSGLLPPELDSGHPPFFGMYLATLWKLFGKSLTVSSFAMLPFLLLNIFAAIQCGRVLLKDKFWLFPLAVVTSPFYLGHSILVSPDVILITGFLLSLYGVLNSKRKYIYIGSLILCLISLRGYAVTIGLLFFLGSTLAANGEKPKLILKKLCYLFGPPIGLFIVYQVYHWLQTSWVGFHDDSPWSTSFNLIDLKSLVRNIVIFCWRLADYGMFLVYLLVAFFIMIKKRRHPLVKLLIILITIFGLLILPFNGLLNHRYFIPIQLVALLMALDFLREYKLLYSVMLIGFLAVGNLIIYPDKLAQGWDVTAAHWPYYQLEKEMYTFIQDSPELAPENVGTAFPLRVARKFLDLESSDSGYHEYNFLTDKYVLYSNVMNDFSDEELEELQGWKVIKTLKGQGVSMILYGRREGLKD